ncbi:hypothetical protein DFH27DRAFT_628511 [Peziza echinospora]|nr:hypothetical protein DFH27DRAFT_628511 [Peziza echinospora]
MWQGGTQDEKQSYFRWDTPSNVGQRCRHWAVYRHMHSGLAFAERERCVMTHASSRCMLKRGLRSPGTTQWGPVGAWRLEWIRAWEWISAQALRLPTSRSLRDICHMAGCVQKRPLPTACPDSAFLPGGAAAGHETGAASGCPQCAAASATEERQPSKTGHADEMFSCSLVSRVSSALAVNLATRVPAGTPLHQASPPLVHTAPVPVISPHSKPSGPSASPPMLHSFQHQIHSLAANIAGALFAEAGCQFLKAFSDPCVERYPPPILW